MTLAATFRSLHVRNFRLFVFGQIVSATGTWMQGVAAPWLVLNLTGSGVALGIDTALQFLPILLVGAWGGLIADRFDNRRVLILCQIAFAVPAFALWMLDATHVVQVWMVYGLSFLSGLVTAVDMPTRQSFYLEMVGREDLTNAMSHRWPDHPPYEGRYDDVVPHLTVAMGRRLRAVARRVEHGLPIDATARELWLMTSGTTGQWWARRRFSLG